METRFHARVLWFFLIGLMVISIIPLIRTEIAGAAVTLRVYDPSGATEIKEIHAPRLDTLAGKTICEVSNAGWEYHRTFPAIREQLQKLFPTAKIIPYTEVVATSAQIDDLKSVASKVKEKGCQAVIVGNAG